MKTCTLVHSLTIIGKNWKQPKCPPTGEWITKLWYILKSLLLSHIVLFGFIHSIYHYLKWSCLPIILITTLERQAWESRFCVLHPHSTKQYTQWVFNKYVSKYGSLNDWYMLLINFITNIYIPINIPVCIFYTLC